MSDHSDQIQEYQDWLRFAQADYDSAKYLYDSPLHPKPLEIICYHCQQAAEKAVKALIVYFGSRGGMPKVHDISFLLGQIQHIVKDEKQEEISDDLMDRAENLSKYGVAPRYPNEIDVDERVTKIAFEDATVLLEWVQMVISKTPAGNEATSTE